jgi:hypothetical protein
MNFRPYDLACPPPCEDYPGIGPPRQTLGAIGLALEPLARQISQRKQPSRHVSHILPNTETGYGYEDRVRAPYGRQ